MATATCGAGSWPVTTFISVSTPAAKRAGSAGAASEEGAEAAATAIATAAATPPACRATRGPWPAGS